jgi:hypothetical protein
LQRVSIPTPTLADVRLRLLRLHRALLDAERAEHERVHGTITPAAFLQLLIADPRFAWLRPLSEIIVGLDEAVLERRTRRENAPPPPDGDALLARTRALIFEGEDAAFAARYRALSSSSGVAAAHQELLGALP